MIREDIRKIVRRLLHPLRMWRNRTLGDVSWQFLLAELYRPLLGRVVFIGVTGSCGKTTTKELIAAVLSSHFKGHKSWGATNQAHRMSRTIFRTRPWHKFCVQEIGANQEIPLEIPLKLVKPQIGVVTNVGTDHISAFRTMEAIAAEKGKLIAALPQNGTAILNADDANVLAMQARCTCQVITYGLNEKAMVRAVKVSSRWPERLSFTVLNGDQSQFVQTQLCGTYWVPCVLAALAVGITMGIPLEVAVQAVQRMAPFPRRMSSVSLPGGATVMRDDFKAPLWTIPLALKFMEEAQAKRKIIVIGTISDFLTPVTRQLPMEISSDAVSIYEKVACQALDVADYVFFVGPWASRCLQARGLLDDKRIQAFSKVQAIIPYLRNFLESGDLVLLKGSHRSVELAPIILTLREK